METKDVIRQECRFWMPLLQCVGDCPKCIMFDRLFKKTYVNGNFHVIAVDELEPLNASVSESFMKIATGKGGGN